MINNQQAFFHARYSPLIPFSKGRRSFSKTAEKRLHPILPTPAETEKIWRVLLQEGVGQHLLKRTETWRGEARVPVSEQ